VSFALFVYLVLCIAVAWIGRNRTLRFWGTFLLAFLFTPLIVALVLIIGTPVRRKETTESAKTTG
jgi:hypothetical protein